CFFAKSDGKPMKRITVSEIQLMYDRGHYMETMRRRLWLRALLEKVNTAVSIVPRDDVSGRSLRKEDNVLFESHEKRLGDADKADVDVLTKVKSQ
ncbi:PREDICTED: parathyroid hormone-like, partial [Myotis brandtii]|uniref:parathyroid hormone-like n=1 Tax=Myotis brandtii TaxID=109478 RepID=UPI000703DC80